MNYVHAAIVGLVIVWCFLIVIWFLMGFTHFTEATD